MGAPEYKIYGPDNKYAAACRSTEHAAVLANYIGDGAQIRLGHDYTLFRRGPQPLSLPEIVRQVHHKESEVRLLHYLQLGQVYSIPEILLKYPTGEREHIKAMILELGDSRRPDRKLDLSRDDRPFIAMSAEEKALMPFEEVGSREYYYCTMQKRSQRK